MSTWFVSRHQGARAWALDQNLVVTHWCDHLDISQIQAGDVVVGTLPLPLAVAACHRGAEYWHLDIELPADLRGVELTGSELYRLGARLVRYDLSLCRIVAQEDHSHP